ncbi:MAG: peptidyl-prolyl cis-trans isomerase SurA [Verrucomicrobiota bacterium]
MRSLFVAMIAGTVLVFASLSQGALAADVEVVDGIAAIVNGEIITFSQVRQVSAPREKMVRSQFTGEELVSKIKEARMSALKDLIDRQLIIQQFKKDSFQIPDHYVDERVKEIVRDDFGGDRNTFIKTLEAQNFSLGQFKKMETEKMIVQAMRMKNVKPTTQVSPTKVQEFYEKHRDEFTAKQQVKLRMIMIPTHAGEENAAAQKALAQEILGKLAAGADFDQMAKMYSEDSTKSSGGDWGWIERKTLAAPLEKVAFSLPPGKVSNIIEVGNNFYILKVDDKHGGKTPSLAEVRPEIEKKLQQQEAEALQERWLASLREKAYIRTF